MLCICYWIVIEQEVVMSTIISGCVFGLGGLNGTDEPKIVSGTGDWTVAKHNDETGHYMIIFDDPFPLYGDGTVTPISKNNLIATIRDISNTYIRVQIVDLDNKPVDSNFNFIVVGE